MDEISNILAGLKVSVQQEKSVDDSALLNHLKNLLELLNTDDTLPYEQKHVGDRLVANGFVYTIKDLLKLTSSIKSETLAVLVQVIAEAAKTDVLRKLCTDTAIIEPLLGLVSCNNHDVVLQACRALGNICYDNDDGRDIVRSKQGMEKLLQLLQNLLQVDSVPDNLHTVVSGCLLNLTDMQEIQDQALQLGIIDLLLKYLQRFSDVEDVAMHCILVLNGIADADCGRKRLMERHTLALLLPNLDRNFSVDVTEVLLELFGNLAESDSVKENLVQLGFCEKLLSVLRRFQGGSSPSEERQNVVKTTCDLIVLVLTGDASMKHVYQNGSGPVYKTTMSWLQSEDDNLKVAGALAAGNFARKDDHCIQMVRDGVAKSLLDLLKGQTGNDGDIRLQHALLAALRNLAIPQAVATKLGLNDQLVEHLVAWCSTDDHPGVKGESVRLLAWIVKNSSSSQVKEVLCRAGALPHWVAMLASEHGVMQNEGLLALALVFVAPSDIAVEELKKTDIVSLLRSILDSPEIGPETLQNGISLTTALSNLGAFKPLLVAAGYKGALSLLKNHRNEAVSKAAMQALSLLEKP